MKKIIQAIDKFNFTIGSIAAWLAIPLTIVVGLEVGLRYFANNPTKWAYDTAWMVFSMYFLLGGGYTMAKKKHVRIDLLYGLLPEKGKTIYDLVFFVILFMPVTLILAFRSTEYAMNAWRTGQALSTTGWGFPAAPIRTFIPIAFFLLAIQGVAEVLRNIYKLIDPSADVETSNE